jgi:hypothetical protein
MSTPQQEFQDAAFRYLRADPATWIMRRCRWGQLRPRKDRVPGKSSFSAWSSVSCSGSDSSSPSPQHPMRSPFNLVRSIPVMAIRSTRQRVISTCCALCRTTAEIMR